MSTITKERAQEIFLGNGPEPTASEERELARIALASLEAEAVKWRVAFTLDGHPGSDFEKTFESQAKMDEVISLHEHAGFSVSITPLYAAPPATVSVPDALANDIDSEDHPHLWSYSNGWNACRAAMLQGAEPVTTGYKLPFEQWLSQQTGTIDVECGCVMTEVFFHWLRVAYEAGNSPVIPDGWVMLPAEPTQAMMNAWLSEVANWRGHAAGYRAMIAAAPKQEVNNDQ